MTTISDLQNSAYERLSYEPGFIPFRFNCGVLKNGYSQAVTWGRNKSNSGVSDLAAVIDGRVIIWIELKQPGEPQLDSQLDFQAAIEADGGLYVIAETMEQIETAIELAKAKFRDAL